MWAGTTCARHVWGSALPACMRSTVGEAPASVSPGRLLDPHFFYGQVQVLSKYLLLQETPEELEQQQSDAGPEALGAVFLGSAPPACTGLSVGETPAKIGSSSAPAMLQIPLERITEGFRLGGTLTPRAPIPLATSLQEPGSSSSSAPMTGASKYALVLQPSPCSTSCTCQHSHALGDRRLLRRFAARITRIASHNQNSMLTVLSSNQLFPSRR